jgi:hypothetical protein
MQRPNMPCHMYLVGTDNGDARRVALTQMEDEIFVHAQDLQSTVLIVLDIDGTILLPAGSLNQSTCPYMLDFYNRVRRRATATRLSVAFGYVTARDAGVPGLSNFTVASLRSAGYLAETHERLILMDSRRVLTQGASYSQRAQEIAKFKKGARERICQTYTPDAVTLLSIGDNWSDILCPTHDSLFRKLANDPKLTKQGTIIVRYVPHEHLLYSGLKM